MNTTVKVISGFAGIGKSYMAKKYPNKVIDLESGIFQYNLDPESDDHEEQKGDKSRLINKDWLKNYIEAIKNAENKYEYVFIAMFPELLNKCLKENIHFIMVSPKQDLKEEYYLRYKNRNNRDSWIENAMNNWDNFFHHNRQFAKENSITFVELKSGEYLKDFLELEY